DGSCLHQLDVLPDLVQLVQLPERMTLPAFVRFGCIDCIYNLLPDALYLSSSRGWVMRGASADRVIHLPLRRRAAARIQDQGVGDMVKRASEVLDYIGGNGCQFKGRGINPGDVVNALRGLQVFLGSNFVGAAF